MRRILIAAALLLAPPAHAQDATAPVRVFLFAGQSNMVGADTDPALAETYPPYVGVTASRADVRFAYSVGRSTSDGWTELAPVDEDFGPELTFARRLVDAGLPDLAIVKCAVGGTTIAKDWNPDAPEDGQKLYPRFVELVRDSLARLDAAGVAWKLEALFWHQGENDMLGRELNPRYEVGLTRFLATLRADLGAPDLPVFLGEISDKGIWGMDFRGPMRDLRAQQRAVVAADEHAWWVPTSHLAFEVMGSGQPHYHFGTLGQLQHGEAYADAWLRSIGRYAAPASPTFDDGFPVARGNDVDVVVLLGQRSMEGEAAFVQDLDPGRRQPRPRVPFRYHLGGGARVSDDWSPLYPVAFLDGFGPELSLGDVLEDQLEGPVAILKFTDGAAQITDWAREHPDASRPCRDDAVSFVNDALADLRARGLNPKLAAVVWHHGENERWYAPFRARYTDLLRGVVEDLRQAFDAPELPWIVAGISARAPWGAAAIDEANAALRALAAEDEHLVFVDTSALPHARVLPGAEGTLRLGELLGARVLEVMRADTAGYLAEAEAPTAREPEGTSFARRFEERWASDRACLVGFHAGGRASWALSAAGDGEHALWLRYASRGGGRLAVGRGALGEAALVEAEVPATGAYEGKGAWAWARVWTGPLDAGAHEFTVRGGPLRLDALWLGPAGGTPPDLGPPPVPAREPELLQAVERSLRAALPPPAVSRGDRAPAWYEATRVSLHTRLSPRWREKPEFVGAADAFASLGAGAYVRHVRTMGEGAWWPSAVGDVEPWAASEPVPGMVERAHERGLRLVAYYRHMEDRGVARDHPDWLCRDDLGRPYDERPVPEACLNSPYADELIVRLQELAARGVDGLYFDEHHQPPEGCFCGFCRARWDELTDGAPFPDAIDAEDPLYSLLGLFTDVTVEGFFARVRAEVRAGHDALAILIGNSGAPDLFDRHASSRLAGFADAIKTEYGKGDSSAARAFFARHDDLAAPPRAARLALGWAYCRDMAGGRPPHVWTNGLRDAVEASAAAAAVVAWGGVANLDCKEARIPGRDTFQAAVALGDELGDLLAGTRPVRRAAVHVSEDARDATRDDRAAWDAALGATNALWTALLRARVPCGVVTDGELRAGLGADVEVLALPAPQVLDEAMRRSIAAFVARGGVVVTSDDELAAAARPVPVDGGPPTAQVVLHRDPADGREVLFVLNDPAWVWTDRRELPGGDPVPLPAGVDVVPAPLVAADVEVPAGFVLARSHPSVLAYAHEPALTLRDHDRRGDERLFAGRFDEAIADWDHVLAAQPEAEPYHWRRGIAFYYAGRHAEGVAQFEVHRTVNPADVENAAWHFLCKARLDGVDAARAALLPVGRDGRAPMAAVYELFAGRATPDDVIAAGAGVADGIFFAHLYVGLYHEALGDRAAARRHIDLAATRYGRPHYMGRVARIHATLFEE